jgi:hypothetical protein
VFMVCVLFIPIVSWAGPFDYTPLEKIPGSDGVAMTDFYIYINAIYKFGIWAVGIAALLMISIGGYMYITSAGNNSSMEKAKSVVTDAVIGLVLALTSYLLLYIINPDLVKIKPLPKVTAPATTRVPLTGPPVITGAGCSKIIKTAQSFMNKGCIYSQPQRNSCSGTPGYTDCSDLVDICYRQSGCSSPGNNSAIIGSKGESIGNSSSLKTGDVIAVPGHVVMCTSDGCATVIGAAGVGKNIKYSNGSFYTSRGGAKVIRASSYCSSC